MSDTVNADLDPIHMDDRLLDRLGSAAPGTETLDDDLSALLLSLRLDAETDPIPALVDTDTAVTLLTATSWWDSNTAVKVVAAVVLFLVVVVTVALLLMIRGS